MQYRISSSTHSWGWTPLQVIKTRHGCSLILDFVQLPIKTNQVETAGASKRLLNFM